MVHDIAEDAECSVVYILDIIRTLADLKLLDGLYQISGDKVIVNEMARKKLQSDVEYYDEVTVICFGFLKK